MSCKILTVQVIHFGPRRRDRFTAEADAVGSHVGDVTIFIQTLSGLHGLTSRHAQLAVGFLLESTGRKRG